MFPTSRPHQITVTDRYGKQIRGTVTYIQPKAERWREDHAVVHITTSDWLVPYRYEAIYTAPGYSYKGLWRIAMSLMRSRTGCLRVRLSG